MIEQRRYAVLGDELSTRLWVAMSRAAIRAAGLPHAVLGCEVAPHDEATLRRLVEGVRRGTITALHAQGPLSCHLYPLVHEIDSSAVRTGVVTTVVREQDKLIGYDARVLGMVDRWQPRLSGGLTAMVIGAGAGGTAAVASCQLLGIAVVGVTSRSWTNTEALHESESAQRMRALGALPMLWPQPASAQPTTHFSRAMRLQFHEFLASAQLVVQATGAPSRSVAALIDWNRLRRDALVVDLVYGPGKSPFLEAAQSRGLEVLEGIDMLVSQCARMLELFTGLRPALATLRESARDALSERLS